ncbi:MAG: hypothetical protein Q4P72_06270 [Eubacteriales bacterium]|nr:hypothetical protein [Eubacteriales bacterium]
MRDGFKDQKEMKLGLTRANADRGSAVLETAVVITVLLAIAIIFHSQIASFAEEVFSKAFNSGSLPSY